MHDTMTENDLPERLLVGVTGSVAALNLPSYLYAFREADIRQLAVVLTPAAERFVSAAALRHVADGVYTEQEQGRGHVALARWAEAVLVVPATANFLGCTAAGLAPTLLSTIMLAADSAVILAPAMNPVMWSKNAVRRNVEILRSDGYQVADPLPGPAYEVASRSIVPGLQPPDAVSLLGLLRRRPVCRENRKAAGTAGRGL